jgi:hypothetical protein
MLSRLAVLQPYGFVLQSSTLVERGRAALSARNRKREEDWCVGILMIL